MSTASEIITQAYRESNLIAISKSPKEAEQTEALARLNVLISGVLGQGVGENLADWHVGTENIEGGLPGWGAYEWSRPRQNVRLLVSSSEAQTIYLPPAPDNGARIAVIDVLGNFATRNFTILGNGRLIEGAQSVTLNTDGITRSWLYQADVAQWMRVESLELESEMPFPSEFDDIFITKLAMRLNPRYGRKVDQQTVQAMNDGLTSLQARYRQRRNVSVSKAVLNIGGASGRSRVGGSIIDPYQGDGVT